jgi:hypothetical protein
MALMAAAIVVELCNKAPRAGDESPRSPLKSRMEFIATIKVKLF